MLPLHDLTISYGRHNNSCFSLNAIKTSRPLTLREKIKNASQVLSESKKSTALFKQESSATADENKKPLKVEIVSVPTYKKPKK